MQMRKIDCFRSFALDSAHVKVRSLKRALASDNRKSRENSCFSNSLKVKSVGKLQWPEFSLNLSQKTKKLKVAFDWEIWI